MNNAKCQNCIHLNLVPGSDVGEILTVCKKGKRDFSNLPNHRYEVELHRSIKCDHFKSKYRKYPLNIELDETGSCDDIVVLKVVDYLYESNRLTWNMYHDFITFERNYGTVLGFATNYKFQYDSNIQASLELTDQDPEITVLNVVQLIINRSLNEFKDYTYYYEEVNA